MLAAYIFTYVTSFCWIDPFIIIKFPSTPSAILLAFFCGNRRAPRKADQMIPQANLKEVEVWSGLFIVPGSVLSQDIEYPHSRWGWRGNCQERWFLSAGPVIITPYLEMLILLLFSYYLHFIKIFFPLRFYLVLSFVSSFCLTLHAGFYTVDETTTSPSLEGVAPCRRWTLFFNPAPMLCCLSNLCASPSSLL